MRWRDAGVDRLDADALVDHRHTVESLADGSQLHVHEVELPAVTRRRAPHRRDVRTARPASIGSVGTGAARSRTTPTAIGVAVLGTWEAPVDDPPYLVPQEFGLRTDCRWFEFVNSSSGRTVRLDVVEPGRDAHLGHALHRGGPLRSGPRDRPATASPRSSSTLDVAHRGPRHGQLRPGRARSLPDPTGRVTASATACPIPPDVCGRKPMARPIRTLPQT